MVPARRASPPISGPVPTPIKGAPELLHRLRRRCGLEASSKESVSTSTAPASFDAALAGSVANIWEARALPSQGPFVIPRSPMEKTDYPVESPPPPARKVRRSPLTMREQGVDAVCHNGQFVMPSDAFDNTPMAIGICQLSIQLYNQTADLMVAKASVEAELDGAEGATRSLLETLCVKLNKLIRRHRSVAHHHRKYVLDVEDGKPVNEPTTNWARQ